MTYKKKLGIWMNHTSAQILKKITDPIERKWRKNLLIRKKHLLANDEVFIYNVF